LDNLHKGAEIIETPPACFFW